MPDRIVKDNDQSWRCIYRSYLQTSLISPDTSQGTMQLEQIQTPTLLLDPVRTLRNIHRLVQKTQLQGVSFRPHFKTHQSHEVGRWFREAGVDKITVSSIGMAQYFATDGWEDITIAFPVNIRQIEAIRELAAKIRLGLLVLDPVTITVLGQNLKHPVTIWIKVDVGTHRTGLEPTSTSIIDQCLEAIRKFPALQFGGFLAHAGHSYRSRSKEDVQQIYDSSLRILMDLKQRYISAWPDLRISLGDTPGSSMVDHFGSVDELRPGNFVFYDLMQQQIGACDADDIAVAMACPVVAVHPERLQWIIYGGAIHFSKDAIKLDNGQICYGRMVEPIEESWSVQNMNLLPYITSLSQEHGVVQCTPETFTLCKPGDLSLWLPVHSCLTADAMGSYLTTKGTVIDHYRGIRNVEA